LLQNKLQIEKEDKAEEKAAAKEIKKRQRAEEEELVRQKKKRERDAEKRARAEEEELVRQKKKRERDAEKRARAEEEELVKQKKKCERDAEKRARAEEEELVKQKKKCERDALLCARAEQEDLEKQAKKRERDALLYARAEQLELEKQAKKRERDALLCKRAEQEELAKQEKKRERDAEKRKRAKEEELAKQKKARDKAALRFHPKHHPGMPPVPYDSPLVRSHSCTRPRYEELYRKEDGSIWADGWWYEERANGDCWWYKVNPEKQLPFHPKHAAGFAPIRPRHMTARRDIHKCDAELRDEHFYTAKDGITYADGWVHAVYGWPYDGQELWTNVEAWHKRDEEDRREYERNQAQPTLHPKHHPGMPPVPYEMLEQLTHYVWRHIPRALTPPVPNHNKPRYKDLYYDKDCNLFADGYLLKKDTLCLGRLHEDGTYGFFWPGLIWSRLGKTCYGAPQVFHPKHAAYTDPVAAHYLKYKDNQPAEYWDEEIDGKMVKVKVDQPKYEDLYATGSEWGQVAADGWLFSLEPKPETLEARAEVLHAQGALLKLAQGRCGIPPTGWSHFSVWTRIPPAVAESDT